jgi:N-acetylglucosamine-1-phosphodiester alpha-N-acetylglucosaminidase
MRRPLWLHGIVLFICSSTATRRPPRLVFAPVNDTTSFATNVYILNEYGRKGYLVSTNELFTVEREAKLTATSTQAQQHDCYIASNGGPFQKTGESIGGVVVDSKVVSTDFSPTNVGFGSSNSSWILGGIDNASEALELGVQYYLTGFDWLVYKGKPTCTQKEDRSGSGAHSRAPRTAIGLDENGHLLLLVVDGCEECFRNKGLTLTELANVFVSHGAYHAINLDGGGSSTLIQDGRVLNFPTCLDIPFKCERPVATIVCIYTIQTSRN